MRQIGDKRSACVDTERITLEKWKMFVTNRISGRQYQSVAFWHLKRAQVNLDWVCNFACYISKLF